MGGCRCTFRDCENATSSRKDLHYFRYPIRYPHRCKVWAEQAGRPEFLGLPKDKLANKVVCQEHFERSMFMNHLCDRLTRLALPRLMKQPDGSVLNVETGLVYWDLADGSIEQARTEPPASMYPAQTPKTQIVIENVRTTDPWYEPPKDEPPVKKIKILNPSALTHSNLNTTACKIIRIETAPSSKLDRPRTVPRVAVERKLVQPSPSSLESRKIASSNEDETSTLVEIDEETYSEGAYGREEELPSTEGPLKEVVDAFDDPPKPSATVVPSRTPPPRPLPPPPAPQVVPVVDPALTEKLQQNSNEIAELKAMLQELVDRSREPKTVTMVAPSVPPPQKVVMEKGPQLTKAQLFSGIKRYLNPTMVTLLRMELFSGAAERPWKPDEKSLAVDLLNIGESVYDHFTEEFRFRLPTKAVAQEWKDAGELDADDAC